jgi:hypothetical protein
MNFAHDNITSKSNLEHEQSISCYLTHCAQQSDRVYEVFYNFIKEVAPSQILEIGTASGGFTAFLKLMCEQHQLNTKILSYDIIEPAWTFQSLRDMGVDVRIVNVFSENHTVVDEEVQQFIKQDGTTIVLCDGGWKTGEFNVLAKYLKSGDYILAHDYAETREIFEKNIYMKIWNWFEISRDDINKTMVEHDLVKYKPELFENVAWVCTTKI